MQHTVTQGTETSTLIDALLAGRRGPRRRRTHQVAAALDEPQKASRTRRICNCGTCPTCLDNARWDRIFREKFADPSYYTPSPVRHGSPLSSFF